MDNRFFVKWKTHFDIKMPSFYPLRALCGTPAPCCPVRAPVRAGVGLSGCSALAPGVYRPGNQASVTIQRYAQAKASNLKQGLNSIIRSLVMFLCSLYERM